MPSYRLLKKINYPSDLRKLNLEELKELILVSNLLEELPESLGELIALKTLSKKH